MNMNMSDADLQYEIEDCEFEHALSLWQQQLPVQLQFIDVLRDASAAFAAQYSKPDGYTFIQTCNELLRFLDINTTLALSEQKLVVQVLQIACAMHENAVNNLSLTPTERSSHYLATTLLVPLCKSAVEKTVNGTSTWDEAIQLHARAEQALNKAMDEMDLSKYMDFDDVLKNNGYEDSTSRTSATPSPATVPSEVGTPSPSTKSAAPTPLEPVDARKGSIQKVPAGARKTLQATNLKEKALAMLNDRPSTGKTAPLGRRHTMPALQAASAPYPSRTSAGRPSKARNLGRGLHAVQESEE